MNIGNPKCSVALPVQRHKKIIERLGQRRVRKDGLLQGRVGPLSHHRNLKQGHQLAAFNAQDSAAQYLFRFGLYHRLHEPTSLAHLDGSSNFTHRQLGYANFQASIPGFRFGDSNPTELRIREDRIWNQAAVRGRIAALEQIRTNDSKVVVRDVGEGRPTFNVAKSINPGYVGLEPFIDLHKALLVTLSSVFTVRLIFSLVSPACKTSEFSNSLIPSSSRILATSSAMSGSSRLSR